MKKYKIHSGELAKLKHDIANEVCILHSIKHQAEKSIKNLNRIKDEFILKCEVIEK